MQFTQILFTVVFPPGHREFSSSEASVPVKSAASMFVLFSVCFSVAVAMEGEACEDEAYFLDECRMALCVGAVALVVLRSYITDLRRVHSAHNLSRLKREGMAVRLGWERSRFRHKAEKFNIFKT